MKTKVIVFEGRDNTLNQTKLENVFGEGCIETYECTEETSLPVILNGIIFDESNSGYDRLFIVDNRHSSSDMNYIALSNFYQKAERVNKDITLSFVEKNYWKNMKNVFSVFCNSRAYTKGYCGEYGTLKYAENSIDMGYYSLNCSVIDIGYLRKLALTDGDEKVNKVFREDIGKLWEYEFILRSLKNNEDDIHVVSVRTITEGIDLSEHFSEEDFETIKLYHTFNKLNVSKKKKGVGKLK